MIPWMSWWNWLRRPPSSPYQFFVVIEARQRLWSLTGATPMTLSTLVSGRLKNDQFSISVAPGRVQHARSRCVSGR